MIARDALSIVVERVEHPGFIAYGLLGVGERPEIAFPIDAWSTSTSPNSLALHGDGWRVHLWEVPIVVWPTRAHFREAVRQTLEALVVNGCRVAWIGAEGLPFCDPPGLFDTSSMAGGVLAWMTDDGHFVCPLDPDRELVPVDNDDLRRLRAHAIELVAGPSGS